MRILLCRELERKYISCEIHPDYYNMILDRLDNNGYIRDEYRLDFIKDKNKKDAKNKVTIFDFI